MKNWNATDFFARLTRTNRLAKSKGFVFRSVSGLEGFEDALGSLQTAPALVCVSDISQGYTRINNTPHTRRVKTVYLAMRHALDDARAREESMDTLREVFRQFMSALLPERTRINEGYIYLDERIAFNEIDRYFFSGCACAFFQISIDIYTDLQHREEEWTEEVE